MRSQHILIEPRDDGEFFSTLNFETGLRVRPIFIKRVSLRLRTPKFVVIVPPICLRSLETMTAEAQGVGRSTEADRPPGSIRTNPAWGGGGWGDCSCGWSAEVANRAWQIHGLLVTGTTGWGWHARSTLTTFQIHSKWDCGHGPLANRSNCARVRRAERRRSLFFDQKGFGRLPRPRLAILATRVNRLRGHPRTQTGTKKGSTKRATMANANSRTSNRHNDA